MPETGNPLLENWNKPKGVKDRFNTSMDALKFGLDSGAYHSYILSGDGDSGIVPKGMVALFADPLNGGYYAEIYILGVSSLTEPEVQARTQNVITGIITKDTPEHVKKRQEQYWKIQRGDDPLSTYMDNLASVELARTEGFPLLVGLYGDEQLYGRTSRGTHSSIAHIRTIETSFAREKLREELEAERIRIRGIN